MAQQREDEKKIQLRQAKELHDNLQAKKAEERYKKHYALCWDVLLQILDLATRIGEYKELAQGYVISDKSCFLHAHITQFLYYS